jgi:uncharacterized protein YjeT (DUF2065 family)
MTEPPIAEAGWRGVMRGSHRMQDGACDSSQAVSFNRAIGVEGERVMKRSTFMAAAAVLAVVFGLSFILAPAQTMSFYGVILELAGQWLGRYLGSAFICIGVLTWFARNAEPGEGLRAVVLGNLAGSVLGLIVAVLDAITGVGNALVWFNVVIYVFLTVGFGYLQFVEGVGS